VSPPAASSRAIAFLIEELERAKTETTVFFGFAEEEDGLGACAEAADAFGGGDVECCGGRGFGGSGGVGGGRSGRRDGSERSG
jgi:hypothetical protein